MQTQKTIYMNTPLRQLSDSLPDRTSFSRRLGDIIADMKAIGELIAAPEVSDIEAAIIRKAIPCVTGQIVARMDVFIFECDYVSDIYTDEDIDDIKEALMLKCQRWTPADRVILLDSLGIGGQK